MNDLRTEIRDAFENEQAPHRPAPTLRDDIAAAFAARPRRAPNYHWLAVAAALLLGLLVVVGLMSTRLAQHSNVPSGPKASPVAELGPPPAGLALVYLHDPNQADSYTAYDWTGKARGRFKLSQPPAGVLLQSPDGQHFLASSGKGGGTVLDRLGNPIPPSTANGPATWADDNLHLCTASFNSATLVDSLVTMVPGGNVHHVADFAKEDNVGQTGVAVAACSFAKDQAVLVRTALAWPTDIWVIRLSDGKILSHHTYTGQTLATVVASPDGEYIAESSARSIPMVSPSGAVSTVLRRVSDWTVVLTLPAYTQVLGFSGDGTHVVISKQPAQYPGPTHLEIIDWIVPHGVWNYDGPEAQVSLIAQPGGSDFAIAFRPLSASAQDPAWDIVIVHGDGSTAKISGRYATLW
jgi:hypothetical protein